MMYGCISELFGFLLFIINIYNCDGVDVVLGSDATLTCPFPPGAWNRWISGGWTLLTNGQKYINVNTTQLTILNVQVADSGDYVCNGLTASKTFYLNVLVPVNGQWSDWSEWSLCSTTCGLGSWTRLRSCTNPAPANGGSYCYGTDNQAEYCNPRTCPENGGWSNWDSWMSCSVTCGDGTRTRYRTCTNPPPSYDGLYCRDTYNENELCNTGTCPALPYIRISKQSYNALIGGNIILDCTSVNSYPEVLEFWWTDSQGSRLNASRYTGGLITNPSLTITGVLASDSGIYNCNARNSVGTSIASTKLFTGNVPSANIVFDHYVSRKGNVSIKIDCQVTNGENLTWFRNNITIQRNAKFDPGNINSSSLVINYVETADRGVYKCYVENIYGSESDETRLKVVHTDIPISSYVKSANESVTLECVIYDATELKWKHNEVIISKDTDKYSGGNALVPSITITKLIRADAGVYQCESSYDSVTSISNEIILRIRDRPLVQSSAQSLQIRVGGEAVIPCSFDSYPEPTNVFWKKDDMTLNSINGLKYNGSSLMSPSLTIYNLINADNGVYVCYVTNELGMGSGTPVRLAVLDASQSASIIGSVAGGVSGGIVAIVLVAVGFLIWTKRKRSTNKQSQDYETPDITKVELHLYEERQRHNSNAIELPVHGSTSETLSNKTFKKYNIRDFMELLQDKTSLNRNTKHEYQLLNVMADLKAAGDYEIIETTSGTVTAEASTNKSLIKKQDDGNGCIIRTVPGQSDIDIFWTEIIDLRARNIVLLVHKMEQISEVFPTTDMSVNTSKFNVELASSEKYPNNIFAFCLAVWNKDKKTEVQVKLYKTTDWKVGEKHPSIDTLCKLLDVVSDQESGLVAFLESNAITFRVCGCLGVCHEVFYAIKAERGFNIPQVAVDLKRMRPDLFQTYEEYNLCYKIIGHFLENQTTYAVID